MAQGTLKLRCPNCRRQFKVLNRPDRTEVPCPNCSEDVSLEEHQDDGSETYALSTAPEPAQPANTTQADDPKNHRWLCLIDGSEVGPIPYKQLRKLALAGTLPRDGKVRRADESDWEPAMSLPGLFEPRKPKPTSETAIRAAEDAPAFLADAPYEDIPETIVIYGKVIMIASIVFGALNVLGSFITTILLGERMDLAFGLFLWGLTAFQCYVWFICYKLGGGLIYGERSAVQGLAALMGAFCVLGLAMIVYQWTSQIVGLIVIAFSVAFFLPPVILAYKHIEAFSE